MTAPGVEFASGPTNPVTITVQSVLAAPMNGASSPTEALGCVRAAVAISEELRAEADDLVGYFVDEARRAGHSWTEIGTSLGVTDDRLRSAVSTTQGSIGEPGTKRAPLSEEARDAIDCAIGLCREHGGTLVGTEHLFFVLASEVGSRSRKLLEGMGIRWPTSSGNSRVSSSHRHTVGGVGAVAAGSDTVQSRSTTARHPGRRHRAAGRGV